MKHATNHTLAIKCGQFTMLPECSIALSLRLTSSDVSKIGGCDNVDPQTACYGSVSLLQWLDMKVKLKARHAQPIRI